MRDVLMLDRESLLEKFHIFYSSIFDCEHNNFYISSYPAKRRGTLYIRNQEDKPLLYSYSIEHDCYTLRTL